MWKIVYFYNLFLVILSIFLGTESTLAKKNNIFILFWDMFINYLILFVTFFAFMLPYFP